MNDDFFFTATVCPEHEQVIYKKMKVVLSLSPDGVRRTHCPTHLIPAASESGAAAKPGPCPAAPAGDTTLGSYDQLNNTMITDVFLQTTDLTGNSATVSEWVSVCQSGSKPKTNQPQLFPKPSVRESR